MQTLTGCSGLKPHSPQEEDHKSRSLCRESNVEGQNHALCQPTIAPGGLEKRGQLCSSIAEQPKARSVHLQVMPRSSNAGAKLPILPRMFPPASTGAQKQKGSFEGKDFLASSCPQREAAEPVGARNPDHTKVTRLFPWASCPWLCQPPKLLQCKNSFLRGSATCCEQTELSFQSHVEHCWKTLALQTLKSFRNFCPNVSH